MLRLVINGHQLQLTDSWFCGAFPSMIGKLRSIKCALVTNQQFHVLLKGNMGAPGNNKRTCGFAEQAHPW